MTVCLQIITCYVPKYKRDNGGSVLPKPQIQHTKLTGRFPISAHLTEGNALRCPATPIAEAKAELPRVCTTAKTQSKALLGKSSRNMSGATFINVAAHSQHGTTLNERPHGAQNPALPGTSLCHVHTFAFSFCCRHLRFQH